MTVDCPARLILREQGGTFAPIGGGQGVAILRELLARFVSGVQWVAVAAVFVAGFELQRRVRASAASVEHWYMVLGIAALAVVGLARRASFAPRSGIIWCRTWAAVALAVASAVAIGLCVPEATAGMDTATVALLWLCSPAALLIGFHFLDLRRGREIDPSGLSRRDWVVALVLLAMAVASRTWHLGTAVPALAFDEAVPMIRTFASRIVQPSPFYVDDMSMPMVFHLLVRGFVQCFSWLGLDLVQTAKLPGVLMASLSVPAFFLAVRVVSGSSIAIAAGGFLILQSWHWLYSRFYYLYAGDLFWIAAATLAILLALKTRRLSLMAAAGIFAAMGFVWLKTALVVGPWVGLVICERLLWRGGEKPRTALLAAVVSLAAFVIVSAPAFAHLQSRPVSMWRFARVQEKRVQARSARGMTPLEAGLGGVRAAFEVLQVEYGDHGRYSLRGESPILDFVSSALFTVGGLWCLFNFLWYRDARLCLLGLIVFLIPVILSYPQDGLAAIPRRAVGASLFASWLVSRGAWLAAGSLVRARAGQAALVALLVLLTSGLNASAIRVGNTPSRRLALWRGDVGVSKVMILRELERSAAAGPVFYYVGRSDLVLRDLAATFGSEVHYVTDLEGLRSELSQRCVSEGWFDCTLLLPWRGQIDGGAEVYQWVDGLADMIPVSAWIPGPVDPAGMPSYRVAHFSLKPAPRGSLPAQPDGRGSE